MNQTKQPVALSPVMHTDLLHVDPTRIGEIILHHTPGALLGEWDIKWAENSPDLAHLQRAAAQLQSTDTPVAFPTETVYGLGADATRSSAVRGIFQAKQRPTDNPLIVHVYSIQQLRGLLRPTPGNDPIPAIYRPLIERFWPGPLTIILPKPTDSVLAPEVTAGLGTFGARMPRSLLALVLIKLAGVPLAAPSANVSTRPSPTAAEHVKDDLDGRIEIVIDGGPCEVGVESTVVDGLTYPPSILRPGGVSIDQLRQCPGWEDVVVGYKNAPENGSQPRAPGMKYRHYSPKAPVILYEASTGQPTVDAILEYTGEGKRIGIIRTHSWPLACGLPVRVADGFADGQAKNGLSASVDVQGLNSTSKTSNGQKISLDEGALTEPGFANLLQSFTQHCTPRASRMILNLHSSSTVELWDINLGSGTESVARGLFSALRELDKNGVDVIFVEGIDDTDGNIATAVMNRLRKAAQITA